MRLFQCQSCGQALYFENTRCEQCGHILGYLPDCGELSAVEPDGAQWIALAYPDARYRFCKNWEHYGCNWMTDAADADPFCIACRHNRTIPDISDPENHQHWQKMEAAKRRLFYSLIKLGLPIPTEASGDPEPLIFDFLEELPNGPKVLTGHDDGLITIALAEADDATREAARQSMGELYRTLLGHFRHEVGHYYWDKLVRDGGELESCRALFGDDRLDYGAALKRHYEQGAPSGWQNNFVSSYATMHPWEDWAESWAHYMHIIDTLEMAAAFGIKIVPPANNDPDMKMEIEGNPYQAGDFKVLTEAWLPLTYALNSLNRSMGQPDTYPFVIAPAVIEKMDYIHKLIHQS